MEKIKVFVTVGAQLPFDRLVGWCIQLSEKYSHMMDFSFQVVDKSDLHSMSPKWAELMNKNEFYEEFVNADIIVSHAGMGNILSAIEFSKPIMVVPRLSAFGEHRNDHQLDTVEYLKNYSDGVVISGKSSEDIESFLMTFVNNGKSGVSKKLHNILSENVEKWILKNI